MIELRRVIVLASLPKQASKLLTLKHASQFPCLKLQSAHELYCSGLFGSNRIQPYLMCCIGLKIRYFNFFMELILENRLKTVGALSNYQ
jgi:hypothetical protein